MSAIKNALIAAAIFAIPSLAEAQGNEAVLFNQSSYTIYSLYISPSASNDWGADQLGEQMIPPGGTFSIFGIPCGTYDVRLTNPQGEVCDVPTVNICAGAEPWVLTDANLQAC